MPVYNIQVFLEQLMTNSQNATSKTSKNRFLAHIFAHWGPNYASIGLKLQAYVDSMPVYNIQVFLEQLTDHS